MKEITMPGVVQFLHDTLGLEPGEVMDSILHDLRSDLIARNWQNFVGLNEADDEFVRYHNWYCQKRKIWPV